MSLVRARFRKGMQWLMPLVVAGLLTSPLAAQPYSAEQLRQNQAVAEALRTLAQRGQREQVEASVRLDPALFSEISPYAADPQAVRLPPDQLLE